MNYNFNDLEKFLRDGGNPEDIAKAFTDNLNSALANFNKERELADRAVDFVDAWNSYADAYFEHTKLPENTKIEDWYIDTKTAKDFFDMLVYVIPILNTCGTAFAEMSTALEGKSNSKDKCNSNCGNTKKCGNKCGEDTFDKVMTDFFDKIGL